MWCLTSVYVVAGFFQFKPAECSKCHSSSITDTVAKSRPLDYITLGKRHGMCGCNPALSCQGHQELANLIVQIG